MKSAIFAIFTALTAASPALAELSFKDQGFKCQAHTTHFEVNLVEKSVFVPYGMIHVQSYDPKAFAELLEEGEEQLKIVDSDLRLKFSLSSCVLNKNSSRLVSCKVSSNESGIFSSNLIFTHLQKSAGGTDQSVTVSRGLKLISANLVVNKVEKQDFLGQPTLRAVGDLEVVAEVAGEPRTLRYIRDLGEWTEKVDRSNWDRCVFTH